ncbi:unknown [Clostridium sp. CAG:356]|nr:unknown [Clostridium sp. CAG:356]
MFHSLLLIIILFHLILSFLLLHLSILNHLVHILNFHLLFPINYHSNFLYLHYLFLNLLVLFLLFLNILILNPIALQTLNYLYDFLIPYYWPMFELDYMSHNYMDMHSVLLLVSVLALMYMIFLESLLSLFYIFLHKILHFDIHFLTSFALTLYIVHLLILLLHLNNIHLYSLFHLYNHLYMCVNLSLF